MAAALFLSGAAGLIFEIVWFYRCGLLLGNTVWAVSIVLSSFMGGLACGSALVGTFGAGIRRVLPVYAWLEMVVAVTGLDLTYVLTALPVWAAPLTEPFLDARWLVNLVRVGIAFPLLLIPTTAMGATLPLLVGALSRHSGRSTGRFGSVLGRLYGWNTFGAVVGVVGAELLLIERAGIAGSAWIAGVLNLAAAATAWAVWSRAPSVRDVDAAPLRATETNTTRATLLVWRPLIAAALMGGNLMALEVVWFRFLSLFIVASTLAASLMLAVVLAAIAVGGLLASRWLKRYPDAARHVAAVAFVAACAVVASYGAFRFLTGTTWAAEWTRIVGFTVVLTAMTALLSGIAFVLLGTALNGASSAPETAAAGWLTLANTTGGMVGPLVAAFVLLPRAGLEGSLFVLTLTYVAIGLLLMWRVPDRRRFARRPAGVAAIAAVLAVTAFPFGSMRQTYFPRATSAYTADGSHVVATREGISETIQLLAKTWLGKPLYYRLVTNGYSMSGTHMTAKRYMRLFAYWPLVLHRGPLRRALVVCYGVGVTAAALTTMSSLESIDVAEISPDITAMSEVIYPPGDRPLADPRVRLHLEDGRYFLQATRDRFDLITAEPPPPLTPGTVNLYTREYFELLRSHLSDGGVVTYWLPVAQRGEYDMKAIIAAFCGVFDDCSMWNGTVFDWMLVGTRQLQGPVSADAFAAAWRDPQVMPRLREIGFEVPEEIGATFLGDAADLRRLSAASPPVTDDRPKRLHPAATRLSLLDAPPGGDPEVSALVRTVTDPVRTREAFARSDYIRRLWPADLAATTLPFFEIQGIINRIMVEGARPLAHIEELHRLLTRSSLRRVPLWALGSDDAQQEAAEAGADDSGMVEYVLGIRGLVARQYLNAAGSFADAERRGLRIPVLRPLLVYALCLGGRLDTARELARYQPPADAEQRHFWQWLDTTFAVHAAAE